MTAFRQASDLYLHSLFAGCQTQMLELKAICEKAGTQKQIAFEQVVIATVSAHVDVLRFLFGVSDIANIHTGLNDKSLADLLHKIADDLAQKPEKIVL